MGRPLRVGGSYGPHPLRARICQGCATPFLGKPNAMYCPACRLIRRHASSNAWKRKMYATSPAFRDEARRRGREWGRAQRDLSWPVACCMCGAPVGKFRGRHRAGAMCVRCRIEHVATAARERRRDRAKRGLLRIRRRPPGAAHHGDAWTAGDDRVLAAAWRSGSPARAVAAALGRTEKATRSRASEIGAGRRARRSA